MRSRFGQAARRRLRRAAAPRWTRLPDLLGLQEGAVPHAQPQPDRFQPGPGHAT